MQLITDKSKLDNLRKAHPVSDYFTDGICAYQYRTYDKYELIQTPDTKDHNLFILLSGSAQIYSLSSDGTKNPIATINAGMTIGEVELFGYYVPFFAEVARKTECIVVSMSECRRALLDDVVFLRFISALLAEKLAFGASMDYGTSDMADRVIYYLTSKPDHMITHVEEATYDLRCSRSSLQRSLAQLCEDGTIEKLGKGAYHLV